MRSNRAQERHNELTLGDRNGRRHCHEAFHPLVGAVPAAEQIGRGRLKRRGKGNQGLYCRKRLTALQRPEIVRCHVHGPSELRLAPR